MKLDLLEIFRENRPPLSAFRGAFGKDDRFETIVACMKSGIFAGWAEATSFWQITSYITECAPTDFLAARDFLAPLPLGGDHHPRVPTPKATAAVQNPPLRQGPAPLPAGITSAGHPGSGNTQGAHETQQLRSETASACHSHLLQFPPFLADLSQHWNRGSTPHTRNAMRNYNHFSFHLAEIERILLMEICVDGYSLQEIE